MVFATEVPTANRKLAQPEDFDPNQQWAIKAFGVRDLKNEEYIQVWWDHPDYPDPEFIPIDDLTDIGKAALAKEEMSRKLLAEKAQREE